PALQAHSATPTNETDLPQFVVPNDEPKIGWKPRAQLPQALLHTVKARIIAQTQGRAIARVISVGNNQIGRRSIREKPFQQIPFFQRIAKPNVLAMESQERSHQRIFDRVQLVIVATGPLGSARVVHIADDCDPKQSARNLMADEDSSKWNQQRAECSGLIKTRR